MSDDVCVFEPNILRAVRFDEWTEGLRQHVKTCGDCAAVAEVSPWMRSLAGAPLPARTLPNASILWIKAQMLQRDAAAERAVTPLHAMQIAAYLVVGACWAAVLTWKWSALKEWIGSFTPAHLVTRATGATVSTVPVSLMILCIALASATVMLAMHTILAEE